MLSRHAAARLASTLSSSSRNDALRRGAHHHRRRELSNVPASDGTSSSSAPLDDVTGGCADETAADADANADAAADANGSRINGVCACRTPGRCPQCSYLALDAAHAIHPYSSMITTNVATPPYPVASASGVHLHLEDGRSVIDGMSSWWAAVHGYNHPTLNAALKGQVDRMAHVMFGGLTHRPASELCGRLVELTPPPLTKVFLCDSGSVSVEVAMKMAVQYWHTVGGIGGGGGDATAATAGTTANAAHGKSKFVSLTNGYHGDTFGAMSVCDPVNGMHSMFTGMLTRQIFVRSPDGPTPEAAELCAAEMEATLAERGHEIAAVIMEPVVQGAGGMRFYHPNLLRAVRESCDRHGVLLIFDEIATGFGRTGTMFACEQDGESFRPWSSTLPENGELPVIPKEENNAGEKCEATGPVVPDILCLGKALTGGYMTMGASMTTDRIAEGISGAGGVFMHGPTFMGNPLASATALASLDLLTSNNPWRRHVKDVESILRESMAPIAELDCVREVRVLGAIGVCELREPIGNVAAVQRALIEEGVWLRPFGKLIYTMPPFNCPELTEGHVERIGWAMYEAATVAAASGSSKK